MSSSRSLISPSGGPVVLCGHLKKLKTLKKKFFVLRGESPGYLACLEYYDSKKKFENRQLPKRSILLHSCFNINKRNDTKHKHVIALYTKDECFSLILESEDELNEWLNAMLLLQGDVPDGEQPRPTFEHVWQVMVQKKGLGERTNIYGPYRLCLTDRKLSLVKVGAKDNSECVEFSLISIRRCGYMCRIFYMEVGRSAVTGGGDFWMEAEDNNIAHNMHTAILSAMSKSNCKEEIVPRQRMRSSSANEASKPISMLPRRHTTQKLHGFSPLAEQRMYKEQVDPLQEQTSTASAPTQCSQSQSTSSNAHTGATGRDRSGSLPSGARTTSNGHQGSTLLGHIRGSHSNGGRGQSNSPSILSVTSRAYSTDSVGSSSVEEGGDGILEEGSAFRCGFSLTPDEPVILEENGDDYAPWSMPLAHHKYSPNFKSHSPSQSSYVEMYSPCGSSPGRGASYMPLSPAVAHSHSRASSLAEDTNLLPNGYVPMAPIGNNGYLDMDPVATHNGHFSDDVSQHGGSSCSITSGTPSTDLRFSEYHLDKVTSFLARGEDLQARPTRAYSVGSKPEQFNRYRKNRLDIAQQEASRVRAFSVGSRSKRPEIGRLAQPVATPLSVGSESSNSSKSSSAPLLSSSWGHNSVCSGLSERMEDLMELDFSRPDTSTVNSSSPSSYPQSQSHSTATDSSSYVDMSPGQQQLISTTASYVDMSGINKINRNNNNNTITANQNHSYIHASSSVSAHKPIITTLKPVEETDNLYIKMDGNVVDWLQSRPSPKQVPSPMQDDCLQTNGPPGGIRTAPVDLPQPRRPPEGYVDMSFKGRPCLEQDYINMTLNTSNRTNCSRTRVNARKEKSHSQPIAILAGSKPSKAPSFLPLNSSPTSESLASTPASPPHTTPTGSSATIFPFSLNSPQSPAKPFAHQKKDENPTTLDTTSEETSDYTLMEPSKRISVTNPVSIAEFNDSSIVSDKTSDTVGLDDAKVTSDSSSQENTFNSIAKKLSELNLSKPRYVAVPLNTSPTLSGFRPPIVQTKSSSSKVNDSTPTQTPTSTPTPTPSPLGNENYEQLHSGKTVLHYASLDLPEITNVGPVTAASVQEGSNYAEIDFAKVKQN